MVSLIVSISFSKVNSIAQASSEKNGSCDGPPVQTVLFESIRLENPKISLLALVFSPLIAIFHSIGLLNSQ